MHNGTNSAYKEGSPVMCDNMDDEPETCYIKQNKLDKSCVILYVASNKLNS